MYLDSVAHYYCDQFGANVQRVDRIYESSTMSYNLIQLLLIKVFTRMDISAVLGMYTRAGSGADLFIQTVGLLVSFHQNILLIMFSPYDSGSMNKLNQQLTSQLQTRRFTSALNIWIDWAVGMY